MQCCAVHSTCLYTTARQNPVAHQHLCSLSISVAPLQPFKQCITPVNTVHPISWQHTSVCSLSARYPGILSPPCASCTTSGHNVAAHHPSGVTKLSITSILSHLPLPSLLSCSLPSLTLTT